MRPHNSLTHSDNTLFLHNSFTHILFYPPYEGEPTGKDNPELLRMHPSVGHAGSIVNGVPRIGFQTGGRKAQWKDEEMAELFLEKAKAFLRDNKDKPFFLYLQSSKQKV